MLMAVSLDGGLCGFSISTSGKQVTELRQDSASGAEFGVVSISPDGSKLAILLADPMGKRISGPNVEIRETRGMKLLSSFSTDDALAGHDLRRGVRNNHCPAAAHTFVVQTSPSVVEYRFRKGIKELF